MRLSIVSTFATPERGRPRLEVEPRPIPRRAGPARRRRGTRTQSGSCGRTSAATASFSWRSCSRPRRTSTPERRTSVVSAPSSRTELDARREPVARQHEHPHRPPRGAVGERVARGDLHVARHPDPGQHRQRAAFERSHDAGPRRDEPRLVATPQDEQRAFGHDVDAKRVRERPVVRDPDHVGQADDLPVEVRRAQPDEARSLERLERGSDACAHVGRRAVDLDPANREEPRLTRDAVRRNAEGEQREADEQRGPRRQQPADVDPAPARQLGGRGLHSRTRPLVLGGHCGHFAARSDAPTGRAAATRADRGTRPRARARPRTAPTRDGAPRPSGRPRPPSRLRRRSR